MTPAAPECARTTNGRCFQFSRRNVFVCTVLFVACAFGLALRSLDLPVSWTADYDGKRYTQIRRAIDADPKHLLGKSLDEISRKLRLEDVPWDDAACQQEPGMYRIYHFRGFALHVTLERLPAGMTPDSRTPWTSTGNELERHGVFWLAHQYPCLKIDGISDGKERMKRYWKAIAEECERINAEMQKRGR